MAGMIMVILEKEADPPYPSEETVWVSAPGSVQLHLLCKELRK